jgi:protein-S-isoprenylcysteine O-methyltransferase
MSVMQQMSKLEKHVDSLQAALEFRHTRLGPHFEGSKGLGRAGLAAAGLGAAAGLHLGLLIACLTLRFLGVQDTYGLICLLTMWSAYFVSLAVFHLLEFLMTAVYQPASLSYDSFVIAHSKAYTVAMLVSWAEFWVESLLFGASKYSAFVCWAGIALAVGGQAIRVVGMRTCGQSFSHIIATERPPQHELITHGIYKYLRHPAYFGWFYWSIATQLILCNPIAAIAFAAWAWYFFASRIPYEEATLTRFYGEKYTDYCRHSYVGIPLIPSGEAARAGAGAQDRAGVFSH